MKRILVKISSTGPISQYKEHSTTYLAHHGNTSLTPSKSSTELAHAYQIGGPSRWTVTESLPSHFRARAIFGACNSSHAAFFGPHARSLAPWKLLIRLFPAGLAGRCFNVRVGLTQELSEGTKHHALASSGPSLELYMQQTLPRRWTLKGYHTHHL